MNQNLKIFGAFFGLSAVIIGAFGTHALGDQLDSNSLRSFEVGVKYQMYHALLMIILGLCIKKDVKYAKLFFYFFTIGIFFFSGSIYVLSTNDLTSFNFTSIAFITPIGGSLLILGWIFTLMSFRMSNYKIYDNKTDN